MTQADVVALVLFLAVTAYAVLGGADFGSGLWDLIAGGSKRGAPTRQLIDNSIGPVWEANHVWLIFVLVLLWTGFPKAFVALTQAVDIPLWLVGLGIVIRGASFAFRKYSPNWQSARLAGAAFAGASLVTPFVLGMVVGTVASGRIDPNNTGDTIWWSATAFLGGTLAVLTCAFMAGVFLTSDAYRLSDTELADSFRHRTLTVAVVAGLVSLVGVAVLALDAPTLFAGLVNRGLGFMVTAAASGLATILFVFNRNYGRARLSATLAVGSVVLGWGVGSYPWILVDHVTIEDGAAHPAAISALIVTSVVAAVLVLPALGLLFWFADRNIVGDGL